MIVSIDGPECAHDKRRCHADGTGSHAETVAGIEHIKGTALAGRTLLRSTFTTLRSSPLRSTSPSLEVRLIQFDAPPRLFAPRLPIGESTEELVAPDLADHPQRQGHCPWRTGESRLRHRVKPELRQQRLTFCGVAVVDALAQSALRRWGRLVSETRGRGRLPSSYADSGVPKEFPASATTFSMSSPLISWIFMSSQSSSPSPISMTCRTLSPVRPSAWFQR